MGKRLYIGNLSYSVKDENLRELFTQVGEVTSATVITDRETGRSKGFGFVEMASDAEAQAAINGLNGQPISGRAVVVNEARDCDQDVDLDRLLPGSQGGLYSMANCVLSCSRHNRQRQDKPIERFLFPWKS